MNNFSKVILPLALIAGSSIYAEIGDRLDTLEEEMKQISAKTPQDTIGASFITANPKVAGGDWFFTFDVTYWHTKMGGTEYAYSVSQFNPSLPLDGDVKDNDFGWDWGLKVGLGRKIPQHDNWDVYARYTWYNTDDSDSTTKPFPSALVALTYYGTFVARTAKSHVDISFNNIDLELGRSFFQSSKLSLRPHFDIKASWLTFNQNAVFTLNDLEFTTRPDLIGLDTKTKDHTNFWGIGPRVGLDSRWFLGYGFHIFGDVAASILYSHFKVNHTTIGPPSEFSFLPDGKQLHIKHDFHRFVPFAQMFLGLGWDTYINDDKQHLGFKLGYEVQYYWRINQAHQPEDFTTSFVPLIPQTRTTYRIQFEKQSEDLMFYGITGEFRIDF